MFEVSDACFPLVSTLLAASAGLKVLATSRAPLRLSAEREYAVEPLELPPPASLPPPDELAHVPAVALFIERSGGATICWRRRSARCCGGWRSSIASCT